MVANTARYAEKFENMAGTLSYPFPEDDYEYHPEQGFRLPMRPFVGADYAHDFLGASRPPKEVAVEQVSFVLWAASYAALETAWDNMVEELVTTGLGKLFSVDAAGNRRWCYARLAGMPSKVVHKHTFQTLQVTVRFLRFSDWFGTVVSSTTAISAASQDIVVTNSGGAYSRNLVLRMRSNSITGFTNPAVQNLATGDSVATTRDATTASDELKIDSYAHRVLFSTNDGASYADDWSLVTLGGTQVALLELAPGANTLRFTNTGVPSYSLELIFFPAFHG